MPERSPGPRPIILLAPAAGGKTAYLIDRLVGEPAEIRPRWAVLPDRTQVASFRRRIAAAGGALGVSVGTFGDLFQEILARAARPVAVAPEPARQRLLRLALRWLEADGRLTYYGPIARTAGFLEVVGEAIAELKRAQVEPAALADWARSLEAEHPGVGPAAEANAPALSELANIYAEYQQRLAAIPWIDREGLNQLAIEALSAQPDLLNDMSMVAVDGFDSFEVAQLAALGALSATAVQLMVTLPGSASMDRTAFRRFAAGLEQLQRALPRSELVELRPTGDGPSGPAAVASRPAHADPLEPSAPEAAFADPRPMTLRQLEANLFQRRTAAIDPEGAIDMVEARNPSEESHEALRWIKARLLRDGLRLEDCALIVPDPQRYGPPLRRAASEYGVRLRFTHGEPLVRAPAVAALLELLQLGHFHWARRPVLQALRSPFFDLSPWGFQAGDALALDAASHAGQVVQGLDQWEQALDQLSRVEQLPSREPLEDDQAAFAPPIGEQASRLLAALGALAARLRPGGFRNLGAWVEWLEDLLDELNYPERVQAESPRRPASAADGEHPAFERLREIMRALVLGEIVAGDQPIGHAEFVDELRGAVEAASYRERLSSEPAVTVLGVLDARGGRYRAVAVLGLAEGVLPEVEREDPFLDEATRQALGLQPRLGREQAGLFYEAVTRADDRLLLTRPYLADDGEAWEASPFWRSVELLIDRKPPRIRPGDARPLADAGSPGELLFWGVRRGSMPTTLLGPQQQRWAALQHSRNVLAARATPQPNGQFEGDLVSASNLLRQHFDFSHTWSPSRLETYGSCPHMFYAVHLLALEVREPPTLGMDAAQLGSILHEILEAAYSSADRPEDPDSVLAALDQAIDPIFEAAPLRYGFRPTPLWAIERAQHAEALRTTIRALAEQGSEWTPTGFELAFGMLGEPSLELEVWPLESADGQAVGSASGAGEDPESVPDPAAGQRIQLRGLIDRLDRRADGGLRVIDYKTGTSRLGAPELEEGRRLQLPLYALAAQAALGLGEVVDGFYWSILAARPGGLRLGRYELPGGDGPAEIGPAAAFAVARQHVARTVEGVRSGRFPPVPPPGGCPAYCPAAAWCWRYQPPGWS